MYTRKGSRTGIESTTRTGPQQPKCDCALAGELRAALERHELEVTTNRSPA